MGAYWKKNQRAVQIDPVVIDYLKNARPKKMLDIVATGQITGDSWQAYSWRWALCHLLANNPNYSGRFKALGLALMSESNASFESVYGPMAREISLEYDQFVRHVDNGYRCDLCFLKWNRKFLLLHGRRRITTKVLARSGWQPTSLKLQAGQSYDYASKGKWRIERGGKELDADGEEGGAGKLVGVVMRDFELGEPFELGTKGSFVHENEGDLYVRCRDAWNRIEDNDGSLTVYFRRTPTK